MNQETCSINRHARGNCSTCLFFRKVHLTPGQGECDRFPPTLLLLPVNRGQLQPGTMSPAVKETHWCGEYKSRIQLTDG
jgi:hypothetical protein